MDLNLDFTGVSRPSFEPVPEGIYELKLVSLEMKDSKQNADNKVAHCFYEVTNSEDHGNEYDGKKVFNTQVLQGPSANPEYIKIWLESLLNEELDGSFSLDIDQILNLECTAFVKVQPDYRDDTKEANAIGYFIPKF